MYILIFLYNFETFPIQIRIRRDVSLICIGLHVKFPLFLSDINETTFLNRFSKNT
jgi:hypothetical protein